MIAESLFGDHRVAQAVIAEVDSEPAGFALWFRTFSTWLCRPGLWLEDLYVSPSQRRAGVGRALLRHIARIALERGYGRVEWSALHWDTPPLDFYDALGAERLHEWRVHRRGAGAGSWWSRSVAGMLALGAGLAREDRTKGEPMGYPVKLASLLAVATGVLALAAPASGATVSTDCLNFGTTLAAANSGDTIVLTGMCKGPQASFQLPASVSDLTIEGAGSGTNGFDGSGVSAPALATATSSQNPGLTLENLTFQNYSLTGEGPVRLVQSSGALPTFSSDRFLNNSNSTQTIAGVLFFAAEPAASNCNDFTGSLTIRDSTFSGNVTTATSNDATVYELGGATSVEFSCMAGSTASLTITDNQFTNNKIETSGEGANGAGLFVDALGGGLLSANQSNNVFDGNSIVSTAPPATSTYGGGGEWLGSVDLTSIGDAFIGNSLPGPSGTSAWSWGAGLFAVRGNCGPTPTTGVSATATDLVAADNTIGARSSGGGVGGAGIYAGVLCPIPAGTGGFHLTLINSTVSGNSGPGGAAGIDGEDTDQLTLENSIVNGDTGAGSSEIGGFGGGITATYSDLCNGAAPYAGTGNICADPKLANVAAGDVHETAASPTIDAGSNALVPSGVTTDFYGQNRVVGTKQSAAIVDMGAAEDQTAFSPAPTGSGTVGISGENATSTGVQATVACAGAATQSCNGKVIVSTTEILNGSQVVGVIASHRHKRLVVVARGSYSLTGGQHVTLKLKLSSKGKKLLKRFGKLPVIVTITQLSAAGQQVTISHHKLSIKARKHRHH